MRYSGMLGFAETVEVTPGVWDDVITEESFIGDLVQRTEAFSTAESVLPQYRTTTSVSVLGHGVLAKNYANLRYVTLNGTSWETSSVVDQFPRIVVYFGEVYHGPFPTPAP